MNDELRDLLVRMLDMWDGKCAGEYWTLTPLFEELRKQLLVDADRRKLAAMTIPTERLDQSAEFAAENRRRERQHMAWELVCSLMASCWSSAFTPGNSADRLMQFALEVTDKFLDRTSRPTQ